MPFTDHQNVTEIATEVTPIIGIAQRKKFSQVRLLIAIAGFVVLASLIAIFFTLLGKHPHQRSPELSFKPSKQRDLLQHDTDAALSSVLPKSALAHKHKHSKRTKANVIQLSENNENIFRCRSQLMIMRHCDKGVKIKVNGETTTTDRRDIFGGGHCSVKGKRRSDYIATLFVKHEESDHFVDSKEITLADKGQHLTSKASKRPQFQAPLRIYALSVERSKKKNYREIETITPLATKFDVPIDDSFGVNEEGELAAKYFQDLSNEVVENVDKMVRYHNATDLYTETIGSQLCNGGMTVVNWKHSLIPALASAFGCGKAEGCPKRYHGSDFDTLWVLTYEYALELDIKNDTYSARHLKKKKEGAVHKDNGIWRVSAQLIKEGFVDQ